MSDKPIKVLTEEGLKVLWNQISLDDYPNNDLLIAVLDGIDATKADKTEVTDAKKEVLERLEAVAAAGADWNQNNDAAIDFIKNRTHWVEASMEEILPKRTLNLTYYEYNDSYSGGWEEELGYSNNMALDEEHIVIVNGVEYRCVGWWYGSTIALGDSRLADYDQEANPENVPFLIAFESEYSSEGLFGEEEYYPASWYTIFDKTFVENAGSVEIEIKKPSDNLTYHTLDENFIPDTIARKSDLQNIDLSSLETKSDAASKLQEAKDYSDANLEVAQAYADAAKAQAITEGANSAVNTINTKLTKYYYDKEQIDNYVLITTDDIDTIWGYSNATTVLKDFNYTTNDNGTYTLTEWKGTTDGANSTECIIPDDSRIIL